jgi:hypothetical protein
MASARRRFLGIGRTSLYRYLKRDGCDNATALQRRCRLTHSNSAFPD